jgi:hypothetical protein
MAAVHLLMYFDSMSLFLVLRTLQGVFSGASEWWSVYILFDQSPKRIHAPSHASTPIWIGIGCAINGCFAVIWHTNDPKHESSMLLNYEYFLVGPAVWHVVRALLQMCFFNLETAAWYIERQCNTRAQDKSIKLDVLIKKSLGEVYAAESVKGVQEYLEDQNEVRHERQNPSFLQLFNDESFKGRTWPVLMWQFFKVLSGGAFFSFYAIKIFDDVGKNGAFANLIFCLPNILGGTFTLCVIDKVNRKRGMTMGILAQGIGFFGMCMMASLDNWDYLYPISFIYILGAAYGQICGYIWYAETIPGMGCYFSYTANRVLSSIVVLFTPIMTDIWPGI